MTTAWSRILVTVVVSGLIAAPDAFAGGEKRRVAVLEFRAGSGAIPDIAARAADILRRKTSLVIVDAADARVAKGGRVDEALATCSGQPRCVAGVGRVLEVEEVLLVGVSEFGDVILTLQRVDVKSARVLSRIAEALAPDATPDDDAIDNYLRRVMPRADFLRWGTIQIDANVEGAHVELGGQPRGQTPLSPLRVRAPATYDIAVEKSGYVGFHASVNVPPDAVVRVQPLLTPASDAWYKKWWVAAIAGTVVVSAVTVAVIATRDDPTDFPVGINPF